MKLRQNFILTFILMCTIFIFSCLRGDYVQVLYSIDNKSDYDLEIISSNWIEMKLDTSLILSRQKLTFYNDGGEYGNFDEYLNELNVLPFEVLKITASNGKILNKNLFDIENWEIDERTLSCSGGEMILLLENENFK